MIVYISVYFCMQDGWTALSSACVNGHYKIAKALLQHGALPDTRKNVSMYTYAIALARMNFSIANYMLLDQFVS